MIASQAPCMADEKIYIFCEGLFPWEYSVIWFRHVWDFYRLQLLGPPMGFGEQGKRGIYFRGT